MLVSSVSVTWLFHYGYPALLIASSAMCVLCGISIYILPTVQPVRDGRENYLNLLRDGVRYSGRHRPVLLLIIFSAVAISLPQSLDEYWSIISTEVGLHKSILGLMFAAFDLVQAGASIVAHRFRTLGSRSLYAGFVVCGALLLLTGTWAHLTSITILILFAAIFTTLNVVLYEKLQNAIPSRIRATISSV